MHLTTAVLSLLPLLVAAAPATDSAASVASTASYAAVSKATSTSVSRTVSKSASSTPHKAPEGDGAKPLSAAIGPPEYTLGSPDFVVSFASTGTYYPTPNGPNSNQRDSLEMVVTDAMTGNFTKCVTSWAQGPAPGKWIKCNDKTFSFKLDQFTELVSFGIEIKHQYRGAGKSCVRSNGPECVTNRGYAKFDKSTPGVNVGTCSHNGGCVIEWHDYVTTKMFSSCTGGCGVISGAY